MSQTIIVSIEPINHNIKPVEWPCKTLGKGSFVDISDEWWTATGGDLQEKGDAIQCSCNITLDFSQVEWVDPLAILGLFTTIKGFCKRTESTLVLNLGSVTPNNRRRNGFIGFIVQHGFLESLAGISDARVTIDGQSHALRSGSLP